MIRATTAHASGSSASSWATPTHLPPSKTRLQTDALTAAGAVRVFEDVAIGAKDDWLGLATAMSGKQVTQLRLPIELRQCLLISK